MKFYLGTHMPNWLATSAVPLFVSRRRLAGRRGLPAASCDWALDSGGFTELSMFGRWRTPPAEYAADAERFAAGVGRMEWAAIQDWMCEPFMLEKTGKSVAEHQELSVQSFLDLTALAPSVPWAPVLQGWVADDYFRHLAMYRSAGVDPASAPVVGVGSVCRRQGTRAVADLIGALAATGLRLHGFGLKLLGLAECAPGLASADSMAWSFRARRSPPLPGCRHASCANCPRFAMAWREKVIRVAARPAQPSLFPAMESANVPG